MSLAGRRIIFYLLLASFLAAAPILVGYTTGYRWSSTQRRIVKIGAISIQTLPANARIILNGKSYAQRTPAFITNLHPGNYKIELAFEGYHQWSKTLAVESEKTVFAHNVALFSEAMPMAKIGDRVSPLVSGKTTPPYLTSVKSYTHYKVFYDPKLDKIVVIDNERHKRIAELYGQNAVWREKDIPLLFVFSANEVWQYNPQDDRAILVTRLTETIKQVVPLPKTDALILIVGNEVRALELDTRDHQNSWTLATFDKIQTAALSDDGKALEILGTYAGKEGLWTLGLQ